MKKRIITVVLALVIIITMALSLTKVINSFIGMAVALGLFVLFSIMMAFYANEQDIAIIKYTMIAFAVLGLFLMVFNIRAYFLTKVDRDYKFQIVVNQKNSNKKLLFTHNEYKYYTYNLSSVDVIMKENEEKLSLKDVLETNRITLDEILSLAIPNQNTDGYKIYYDGGQPKYSSDQYSIIVCDNKNIIFSTFNYTYEDGICE